MSTPQMEISLDQWISISEGLSPFENFALLGLIHEHPYISLDLLQAQPTVTDGNLRAAEKWALTRMRRGLKLFCDNYQKSKVKVAAEFVRTYAPFIMVELKTPRGAGVAFLFWAIGFGLVKWCGKYGSKQLKGKGVYFGDIPQGELEAYFDLTYFPAIYGKVEDEKAYPLVPYKPEIKVPAESSGTVALPPGTNLDQITLSLTAETKHVFKFEDTEHKRMISGQVKKAYPAYEVGKNALRIESGEWI